MKKAQGISVNVIIIAAIALLVLVVLSVIFIGRMGNWGKTTNDCEANGGRCATIYATCGEGEIYYPAWDCPGDGPSIDQKYCCVGADNEFLRESNRD